jgi:small neutral amino acid transporter SnatA (MarC family)
MSLMSAATSLFFVLNSLGNVPFFVGVLSHYPIKRQRKIILREMLIALLILLLLFLISLSMIFPKPKTLKVPPREPFIFPLAVPAVAGPGAITAVMIYSQQFGSPFLMILPILIAWVGSALVLITSSNIKLFLGQKWLSACERLGGMIICLIAVQMFTQGIIELIQNNLSA